MIVSLGTCFVYESSGSGRKVGGREVTRKEQVDWKKLKLERKKKNLLSSSGEEDNSKEESRE
jgi:hypothetical protein